MTVNVTLIPSDQAVEAAVEAVHTDGGHTGCSIYPRTLASLAEGAFDAADLPETERIGLRVTAHRDAPHYSKWMPPLGTRYTLKRTAGGWVLEYAWRDRSCAKLDTLHVPATMPDATRRALRQQGLRVVTQEALSERAAA